LHTDKTKELLGFIRINICLYTASLAAIGYLLAGKPGHQLAYVMLSALFGCAAAYAYNNITDVKEDLINRKRMNHFSDKSSGKAIVALCAILGAALALKLPAAASLSYLSFTALLMAYSALRIKERLLLKNAWTALGVSQAFLIGAFTAPAGAAIIGAYLAMSLLLFAGSIIADMRDVEGDAKTGIITLPVRFGIPFSIKIIWLLFLSASALIIKTTSLYVLLPFSLVSLLLASKGRFSDAHLVGGISFLALFASLLALGPGI